MASWAHTPKYGQNSTLHVYRFFVSTLQPVIREVKGRRLSSTFIAVGIVPAYPQLQASTFKIHIQEHGGDLEDTIAR